MSVTIVDIILRSTFYCNFYMYTDCFTLLLYYLLNLFHIQVNVSNPHIDLILEISNADGSTKEVQFEGHSRNNVYRRGWRPDAVKEGDVITIKIAPMRNGEDGGYIQEFNLADGRTF